MSLREYALESWQNLMIHKVRSGLAALASADKAGPMERHLP